MNDVELTEHRVLTALFIDSHRPERRYLRREDLAEYFVSVSPAMFRGIVLDLRKQGLVKAVPDGGAFVTRMNSDAYKAVASRILQILAVDTFSVDWQTKRILHDGKAGELENLIPAPEGWMLLAVAPKADKKIEATVELTPTRQSDAETLSNAVRGGGAMGWITKYMAVWQGRIALGLAFFAAIVVGLWPDHHREIDPIRLMACILAGSAWLVAELASATGNVSKHDIGLFERINSVMHDGALTFLKEHDFAHDLHVTQTEPINRIAQWHGPNFVFNDEAIQRRWQDIFARVTELSGAYGKTLVNTDRENILTAWLLGYSRHDQPQGAKDEVQALNDAASALYQTFSEFALFVRKRLDL